MISSAEAQRIAEDAAVNRVAEREDGKLTPHIKEFDKELEIAPKLNESVYIYTFDIQIATDRWMYEVEVEVNAKTGQTRIVDLDME